MSQETIKIQTKVLEEGSIESSQMLVLVSNACEMLMQALEKAGNYNIPEMGIVSKLLQLIPVEDAIKIIKEKIGLKRALDFRMDQHPDWIDVFNKIEDLN